MCVYTCTHICITSYILQIPIYYNSDTHELYNTGKFVYIANYITTIS